MVPNSSNEYLPGVIQIPSTLLITAITKSYPMQVTFTVSPVTASNTYIPGQLVRLTVPGTYGMPQANGLTGEILTVNSTTMTLDINSSGFDTFAVPAITKERPASLSPAGSRNLAFSNITGQVPFQSLNDKGN